MPITEQEAADALRSLPQSSWLRKYVRHGFKQTTAPMVYHVGVGITMLGVTCPIHYGMDYAGPLYANNYTLLVGRSGEDNKSSALRVGTRILKEAAPQLVGDFPGSPEGLYEMLEQVPSQVIPISEFGKFLSSAQRGYFEPIKTLLADTWDCDKLSRIRANKKNVVVETPRLSIAAACSIPYLEKHTLLEDWTGGFMGRWFVLYGRREREDPDPTGDDSELDFLIDGLRDRSTRISAGWCRGLDYGAKAMWDDWYMKLMQTPLPDNIIGIRARAPTIARKISMILAWDLIDVEGPWLIPMEVLLPALEITELHIRSLIELSADLAEHDDARLRRLVLRAIENKGNAATLGEILEILKMRKRPVVETLDALIESGIIAKVKTTLDADTMTYVITGKADLYALGS